MSTMLRDYWYIACAASRLGAAPLAIQVLDQELVVFKDASGGAHALLDRCCHRGARLSLGTVTDGALACGYHGWRYDGTGRCMHIPSLPSDRRMPAGVGVRAFPCAAQDSYLWVWMGETHAQPAPPPRLPELERYAWQQGSITFRCDAMKAIENNVDWCHPPFTHLGTHPFYFGVRDHGFREYAYEVRTTERGLVRCAPPRARLGGGRARHHRGGRADPRTGLGRRALRAPRPRESRVSRARPDAADHCYALRADGPEQLPARMALYACLGGRGTGRMERPGARGLRAGQGHLGEVPALVRP